jgi:IstB-like ATP binding protein
MRLRPRRDSREIIDEWRPEPLTAEQRRDLLEIVEDRYEKGSLLMTSQIPMKRWPTSSSIRRLGMPSWIASFILPTASSSRDLACVTSCGECSGRARRHR